MSVFGSLFKISTFGESHCSHVGVVVDGVPPGLPLTAADIQPQLSRRRPGQSNLTTPRNEQDQVQLLSGVEKGFTLGTPIAMVVANQDQRPHDYSETDLYPRPSHADYTYLLKYNMKASSGGGRSSARETIGIILPVHSLLGRVAAGAIAEKYLSMIHQVEIVAFVASVGEVAMNMPSDDIHNKQEFMNQWEEWWSFLKKVQRQDVDSTLVRCPDKQVAEQMEKRILHAKENHDSIGGTIVCVIRNVPGGLGEPCFDKLEALLAHAMMSIPSTKGFEIGSGFSGTKIPGHVHNDPFVEKNGRLGTLTNFSGGIQGGISNGEDIYLKVAFKPPATIGKPQLSTTYDGEKGVLEAKGRHDPCVVPRAISIVETMAALVMMDCLMIQKGRLASSQTLTSSADIPAVLQGKFRN